MATRPLLDAIAGSARRPTQRTGRLLYGPAPAGLAPYRRILDALGLRADGVLLRDWAWRRQLPCQTARARPGSAAAIDHSQDMVDATRRQSAARWPLAAYSSG